MIEAMFKKVDVILQNVFLRWKLKIKEHTQWTRTQENC